MPIYPEIVKNDSWWTDPKRDPHVPPYIEQGLIGPTKPDYFAYNPAWAQVRAEHPFNVAFHEIVAAGKPVKEAAAKAMKRVEEIFAKYQIGATLTLHREARRVRVAEPTLARIATAPPAAARFRR